jgi:succinate-semialdehyde dehydrogenase/glutarate-semialdehyde dehydrogenase
MEHDRLLIGGNWVEADDRGTLRVEDPATGETAATVAFGGHREAEAAVAAAWDAFPAWAGETAAARARVLLGAARLLEEQADALARLLTSEEGKPLAEARGEVLYAAEYLQWNAEEARRVYGEIIPSTQAGQRLFVLRQPVGVVAAVTPWNFPAAMVTRKIAPALAVGCTVVLKPSVKAPRTALAIGRVFQEAGLPAGVLNVVVGEASAMGEVFATDPRVRKITFTGSAEVGRSLSARAAQAVKRVSLELGGHAPFIVFADADLAEAVRGLAFAKFLNAGQTCVSPNRVYVERSIVERFTEHLCARIQGYRLGNGLEQGVRMGPLIDEAAVAKVALHVEEAVASGARLLLGGRRLERPGHFFPPTVLVDVLDGMRVAREETFGPVVPILTFTDEDEVIRRANGMGFGLAAYVYTRDVKRAHRVFERLEYGLIAVNDANPAVSPAPFGGMKESGIGREGGHFGIHEFLEVKAGAFGV